jgi:hypothetical protein
MLFLAGILLPGLGKSRQHASQVKCMAHLRQVGVFTQDHVLSNDGRFPSLFFSFSEAASGAFTVTIHGAAHAMHGGNGHDLARRAGQPAQMGGQTPRDDVEGPWI